MIIKFFIWIIFSFHLQTFKDILRTEVINSNKDTCCFIHVSILKAKWSKREKLLKWDQGCEINHDLQMDDSQHQKNAEYVWFIP